MSKKLEELIKSKIEVKTDEHFEANFFKMFENEFGSELKTKTQITTPTFWQNIFNSNWIKPTALAFCLVISVVIGNNYYQDQKNQYTLISQLAPVLEDLDMLASNELEQNQELIDLTDEEWEVLLAQES